MAGLGNKDKEFWKGLREWDVMTLVETWIDEKSWRKMRGRLPERYEWRVQHAKRKNKRSWAMRGL